MSLVLELDDEWIVLVVDKKTAAKLLWLCGEVSAEDSDTYTVFDDLIAIKEVEDIYDKLVKNRVVGSSTVAFKFPEVK